MTAEILSFETGRPAEITDSEAALVVDVEGYEGPLDLLLTLARQQKVDLAKISILALADQYLTFIEAAKDPPRTRGRLPRDGCLARLPEITPAAARTADAGRTECGGDGDCACQPAAPARGYPRSRQPADEPAAVPARYFPRGNPESIAEIRHPSSPRPCSTCSPPMPCSASSACWRLHLAKRTVWSLAEARASLERLVGMTEAEDWSCLDDYLLSYVVDPSQRATVFASSLRSPRTGARRRDGIEPERGVRAAVFS